jgi:hypothetical protein
MKKSIKQFVALLVISNMMFTACTKEKVTEENTEELITTVIVKLTPVVGGSPLEFKYEDVDGVGGAAATFQEIVIAPNKVYNAQIILLDKTKSPVDTISTEVKEEGTDHQFYFTPNSGVNLTVSNLDTDLLGRPLGLTSTWTTGAASTGKIFITLKHKPGIKSTNDAITVGETDISTEDAFNGFVLKIE